LDQASWRVGKFEGKMRFTLLTLAGCQSLAMRPQLGRAAASKHLASIGEIVSKISSPKDSLAALKEVSSEISILMEQGPIDDHVSDDDRQLLSSVTALISKTIYSSMDDSHNADVAELDGAIKAAEKCNADIAARQSPEGDLGTLHSAVQDKQTELNRLQGIVDDKTNINNTEWEAFDLHMQMISEPPTCPGLPARTMPALDVFFEKSDYSIWFTAQQAQYEPMRDAFKAADAALTEAIQAYDIQKAIRDVQYCDWKSELEAACAAFDTCFQEKSDFYTKTSVPRVTSDMNNRIEVKKAGDTVIHQINFLLGDAAQQETPTIDTSRYQIDFPTLPAKGVCDLAPLEADEWVPTVTCSAASFAGTYEVWYRGAKRNENMNIDCENNLKGHGGSSRLQFEGVKAKCHTTRDAAATMFSVGLHGAQKHECLHAEGTDLVGSHYDAPTRYWGTITYKLISAVKCA